VQSFPKINQLQMDFKDEIQFLMVAKNDAKDNSGIRQMYEKFRLKQDLKLAVAYDSSLFYRFGVQTTPHVIIINPKGIVQSVTYSEELTKENLQLMVAGKTASFKKKYNVFEENPSQDISIDDSFFKDEEFMYKSILRKWTKDMPIRILTQIDQPKQGHFQTTGISLSRLYNIAYFGRTDWNFRDSLYANLWRDPVLELDDPSPFQCDANSGTGYYNYSLIIPKDRSDRAHMLWSMQCDLKKYFQYNVSIETRRMPNWSLVSSNKKIVKTLGGSPIIKGDHSGYSFKNTSVQSLLEVIWSYHQLEPPLIDATGITENVDITLEAVMTDFKDVNRALTENGLGLIRRYKEMKVLVIRDANRTLK